MPSIIHNVPFLLKRILGDVTKLRDHHKVLLIFFSEGSRQMIFGSKNLTHWLEERKETDEFQAALDDDVLHLMETDAAPPAARPTAGDLTRFFTPEQPAKLPLPLRMMKYPELWNWLSKYFFYSS